MSKTLTEANLNDPLTLHMRTDFARLQPNQTVGEALAEIREHPPADRIIYFYVVGDDGKLQGVVPTRRMLLSPVDKRISQIMVGDVVAIPTSASVLDACEFFVFHRFLAFPVVDFQRRIVGVVDVELYTDEMTEIAGDHGEDLFQLIGIHLENARQTSPIKVFRGRFPWLICNIIGGISAALIIGVFKAELERAVTLALFIPVVLGLAESVSVQSVSIALQMLHAKPPSWASLLGKLRREFLNGILLGCVSGLLVGGMALVWPSHLQVVGCVLAAIAGGVTCSAVVGIAAPNLMRLLKLDPQVAAGPIALAISDVFTLVIYFSTARWLMG
jgi:magnesium transporter